LTVCDEFGSVCEDADMRKKREEKQTEINEKKDRNK